MSRPHPEHDSVSLADVLRRMEQEAGCLAGMGEEIQDVLSKTLGSAALTSQDLVAVQALDSLAQRLAGLSVFLGRLATQVPDEWAVRPALAAETVTLAGLAHRLAMGGPEQLPAVSGEAHLF